ncbi:MAG: hypothetical protein QHH10_10430 [Peptococcaceae bacterium]|nr:hypothetical protein [Peptococcaceae bacterium]MDH7525714.1 hypothetical protein [Peptococcaceae bacterium]
MFLAALSLAAGFLLNEEASLDRLCRRMVYPHPGWMVFKDNLGLLVFILAWVFAFLKGYAWGLFLKNGNREFLAASGLYVIGNVLAVRKAKGLFFTPWLAVLGLMAAQKVQVFQGSLTVLAVSWLASRDLEKGLKLWQASFLFFLLFFSSWAEGLWWAGIFAAAALISGRQSPFLKSAIKYFEKNMRWRVPT